MQIVNQVFAKRLGAAVILAAALALLCGCATTAPSTNTAGPAAANDPLEPFNRAMFNFNTRLDEALFKPVAEGYKRVTPEPVDQAVTNFFSNLGDIVVVVNDVFQLKLTQAVIDAQRVIYNTTFGLGGLIDIATLMGLPKHNEDFGQTVGYWGVGEGAYMVLPFIGSTTVRDFFARPVDLAFSPLTYVDAVSAVAAARGISAIDQRADLLDVERALGDVAIDPYTFWRELHLQRRRSLVLDGEVPNEEDALFDELDALDGTEPEPTE